MYVLWRRRTYHIYSSALAITLITLIGQHSAWRFLDIATCRYHHKQPRMSERGQVLRDIDSAKLRTCLYTYLYIGLVGKKGQGRICLQYRTSWAHLAIYSPIPAQIAPMLMCTWGLYSRVLRYCSPSCFAYIGNPGEEANYWIGTRRYWPMCLGGGRGLKIPWHLYAIPT